MQIKNIKIPNGSTFLVAEIGQNHNGDMKIAKSLIDVASIPIYYQGEKIRGVDAVKFCIRSRKVIQQTPSFDRLYDNPNSFGKTYKDHRLALEFTLEQHAELKAYAEAKGLIWFASVCDHDVILETEAMEIPCYKVASRDALNLPLLSHLKATHKPLIISTGMTNRAEFHQLLLEIPVDRTALLVCTSAYPTRFEDSKLDWLRHIKETYRIPVGWSDHTRGEAMAIAAVGAGACIIEKHITLDNTMKGSDHAGALEPPYLWKMVRAVRNTEKALRSKPLFLPCEEGARQKLRIQEGRDTYDLGS